MMKIQLLIVFFCISIELLAQHPYKDALKDIYTIDEKEIFSKTDTTICLMRKRAGEEVTVCQQMIICRNKELKVIRVDKIYEDTLRFAYAYFDNGIFRLMQWNSVDYRSIHESASDIQIMSKGLGDFYDSLLMLKDIMIPEEEKIRCGLGGVMNEPQ